MAFAITSFSEAPFASDSSDVIAYAQGSSLTTSLGNSTLVANSNVSVTGSQATITNAGAIGGASVLVSVTGSQLTTSIGEEAINIEEVFDGSVIKRGEIVDSDFDMIEEVKPIVEAQNAELEYKQKIETKIRDSQLTYSKSQNNCAHIVARILGVINPSILPENKKAELFLLPGEVFDNSIKHKLGKLHEQRTELLKDVNSNIKLLIKNTQEAIKDELSMVKARKSCAFRGFFSFDSFNIEAREKKLKTLDKLLTNIEKNPDQIKVHLKNASKDLSGITKKEIEQLISIMDNKPSPSVPSRANII